MCTRSRSFNTYKIYTRIILLLLLYNNWKTDGPLIYGQVLGGLAKRRLSCRMCTACICMHFTLFHTRYGIIISHMTYIYCIYIFPPTTLRESRGINYKRNNLTHGGGGGGRLEGIYLYVIWVRNLIATTTTTMRIDYFISLKQKLNGRAVIRPVRRIRRQYLIRTIFSFLFYWNGKKWMFSRRGLTTRCAKETFAMVRVLRKCVTVVFCFVSFYVLKTFMWSSFAATLCLYANTQLELLIIISRFVFN